MPGVLNKPKRKFGNKRVASYKTLTGAYERYLTGVEKGTKYDIDKKTYKDICIAFNKKIIDYLIMEAGEFHLPCRLGALRIKKRKMSLNPNKKRIDWGLTQKMNKIIYFVNNHSNGFYMRYWWLKEIVKVTNSQYYYFIPSWGNKKLLSQAIFNNPKLDFFE